MAIIYVTSGAWGAGTGAPNSAAQVDGNFYDLDQQLVDLSDALAEGKRIESVTYTDTGMTFHFTDGTTQTIPLPVAHISYVGQWTNATPYARASMVSVPGSGMYQVLVDHTTPPAPAAFDPNATDGSGNPLYSFWMPLYDVNYDAAIFVPGSLQREEGELLFVGIANRSMGLRSGNAHAYAYLDTGLESPGATDIILSIEKNRIEIGTVTFPAAGEIATDGSQNGTISIPVAVEFAEGDSYGIRVTQSDNVEASGLSITLPFRRTDV